MTGKASGATIAAVVGLVLACTAGGVLTVGGGTTVGCPRRLPTNAVSGIVAGSAPAGGWQPVGRFDTEQVGHAATIVAVGAQSGVRVRGWVIAVATAIQESGLRNLPGGADDSVGLFQQRPSQGWGTAAQLHDSVYAAGKFYEKLLTVAGWQKMPLTEAAQAVQRSAYPDAYGRHEPDAIMLVTAVASGGSSATPQDVEQCPSSCTTTISTATSGGPLATASAVATTCEWVAPVRAPVVSGFRTGQRPTHNGVDLGAARGTPILAASTGTVVVVRCNVVPARHGCDRDGSPSTPGCGWYVDIRHTGQVHTRYCHLLTRPAVVEGQAVAAGQVIGVVGSSGHSSGPHLHLEVHVAGRNEGAVDPVVFMAERGVRLG